MRVTIPLPLAGPVDWHALEHEENFLYRRIADRDRELLFVGSLYELSAPEFINGVAKDWYHGHLQYDLKNELEPLRSRHPDRSGIPLQQWSVPRWIVEWKSGSAVLHAYGNDVGPGMEFCATLFGPPRSKPVEHELQWKSSTSREHYLEQVGRLLRHIQRGDIYEVNYCIERTAMAAGSDPFALFPRLLANTGASFAAFHRHGDRFALCASPERFLYFDGPMVMAQPMKGTRPRSGDPVEDARLAAELAADEKERSENIMALDVARHDLSKIAASGSVKVQELCVVHAHGRVHQMISIVSARIAEGLSPVDVLRATFPMASMTGAPKFRAMQLIDEVEDRRRGLFSGSLGFFSPDGTGDLNVVIRTLFFDAAAGTISLPTGSAITALCDPEREWEECELKARSVMDAIR